MKFKCLMYNVFLHWPGYGNIIRANRIRTFLQKGDWDITGLAEVYSSRQCQMLLNDAGIQKVYPYHLSKNHINKNSMNFDNKSTGLVLLSRHKIIKAELYTYRATQKKIFPLSLLSQKGIIYAEIKKEDKIVGVFLTHLYWGRTRDQIQIRSAQLIELKQYIRAKRQDDKEDIILGDLNLMDKEYKGLMDTLIDFKDAWKEIHGENDVGHTWRMQNTFVYFLLGNYRYDYLLTSLGIKTKSIKILQPKNTIKIIPRKPYSEDITPAIIYYETMKYLRWLFLPFGIILHLWRLILRLPSGLFSPMDLSDHYPLEGEFEI